MEEIKNYLVELLEAEDKEACYSYTMGLLKEDKIDVIELYSKVLTPILNNWECKLKDKNICIWKEHVRTAIVRTIVESCYPYIIQKRNDLQPIQKGTAVVMCPPEEYHDLGARMVADFLTVMGYESIFVGQNTPYKDFMNAIYTIEPSVIAISVGNYYNLVATKKIIQEIRETVNNPIHIIVGGVAFNGKQEIAEKIGADYLSKSFDDLKNILEKEVNAQ